MNNANKNLRNIVRKCHGDSKLISEYCKEENIETIKNIKDLKKSVLLTDYDTKDFPIKQSEYPYLYEIIEHFFQDTTITYISLEDILYYIYHHNKSKENIKMVEYDLIKSYFNGVKLIVVDNKES